MIGTPVGSGRLAWVQTAGHVQMPWARHRARSGLNTRLFLVSPPTQRSDRRSSETLWLTSIDVLPITWFYSDRTQSGAGRSSLLSVPRWRLGVSHASTPMRRAR